MPEVTIGLNKDEQFYKEYYQASKSPDTLKRFLSHVDQQDAIDRHLVIPELLPEIISYEMKDTEYFKEGDGRHVFISRHNRYTPAFMHRHDFFEIIFVYAGHCVQSIDMERKRFDAGDLIFIAPHFYHTMEVFDDDSLIFNILLRKKTFYQVFSPMMKNHDALGTFFSEGLYHEKQIKYLVFHLSHGKLDTPQKYMMRMYEEQLHHDDYSDQILIGMLTALNALVMRNEQDAMEYSSEAQENKASDVRILSYIQNHLDAVTLDDIADHFGFSVAYCSRLVKDTTGFTFTRWKRILRVRSAERLLQNTDISIEEIGTKLGYENPETFIRSFKKEMHITPAKYRRQSKINSQTPEEPVNSTISVNP